MLIRKALPADASAMQALINGFADRGEMLHRSMSQLYEYIRDFWVAEEDGAVVGCAALHVMWQDLAEVKSLAVSDLLQGRGVGRALVQHCLSEAADLRIHRVYALTYKPGFFAKLGFRVIDRAELPRKVWTECVFCPKFNGCDEIAVAIDLPR